jgi:glutamyl-tRNA synthetase
MDRQPRGRWAPTPSGFLHLGNARTALWTWLSARSRGGKLVFRLEDLDGPRTVPGAAAAGEEDLRWLGLDWDEGPDRGGLHAPYVQSLRGAFYEAALDRLEAAGRLFPCGLSRLELERLASSAPHGKESSPYPREQRPLSLEPGWLEDLRRRLPRADAAIRFRVADGAEVVFEDRLWGQRRERVDLAVGDFVLRRRDGLWAYQLAVVVDDLEMGITEVVRGRDLLDSTARQIELIEALGGTRPEYLHLPLVLDAAGEKLSKRHQALTLRSLREAGVSPRRLTGYLAYSLGLLERPRDLAPAELLPLAVEESLRKEDFALPADLSAELRGLSPGAAGLPAGGWRTPA